MPPRFWREAFRPKRAAGRQWVRRVAQSIPPRLASVSSGPLARPRLRAVRLSRRCCGNRCRMAAAIWSM
eukprot:5272999-Lingulodinium_polyedra.AAC.1